MPELLARKPEIVMKILINNGAKCNTGEKQQILTNCPPDKFCSLKTGEFCIYGVNELSHSSQIQPMDMYFSDWVYISITIMILIFGMFCGWMLKSMFSKN